MLQRSWTVEHDEAGDVPGAVYVGKASFRMVRVAEEKPQDGGSAQGEGVKVGASGRPTLLAERVQTERIVLVPGSIRVDRPTEFAGVHRKPLSLVFGVAFGVGVMCTLVGQVVLHSRERLARERSSSAGVVAMAAESVSRAKPPSSPTAHADRAVPAPVGVPDAMGLDVGIDPVVARPSIAATPGGVTPPVATGDVGDAGGPAASRIADGMADGSMAGSMAGSMERKLRARTVRRAARASSQAARPRGHSSTTWVDPFATDGARSIEAPVEGAPAVVGKSEEGSAGATERKTTARGWVDPFVE